MMPSRCVAGGTAPAGGQKQKFSDLCNFFSIRDSLPPRQSENRPLYGQLSTFSRPDPRFGATRQSLIAKKLQSEPIFCFQAPMTAFGKAMGETARAQCYRWSGLDAMLWGAIRTQRRKAAAGRYGERCGKAAPETCPSQQACGPKIRTTRIAGSLLLGYNPRDAGQRLKTPAFTLFRPNRP